MSFAHPWHHSEVPPVCGQGILACGW